MITITETAKKLKTIGLSRDEAMVYGYLLENGQSKSLPIQRATGLTKPLVYRALHDLTERGLVVQNKRPGHVTEFSPTDPRGLRAHFARQRADIELASETLEHMLPEFSTLYRETYGKPPIQYYEGPTGIQAVFADLETANETIYAYIDMEATRDHLGDINAEYMKKRIARHTTKRILAVDSPYAREFFAANPSPFTEVRYIPTKPFQTSLQIYDNKIVYLTIVPNGPLGIIVEDQLLYAMHRELFQLLWEKSSKANS